jgi:hypothetical protein
MSEDHANNQRRIIRNILRNCGLRGDERKIITDVSRLCTKHARTNQQFAYIFTTAGTFGYVCTIHPTMKGKVIVR